MCQKHNQEQGRANVLAMSEKNLCDAINNEGNERKSQNYLQLKAI